jgi:hypothetical protein
MLATDRGGLRADFLLAQHVPVTFFYDDVDPVRAPPVIEQAEQADVLHALETVNLVTAYYEIGQQATRRRLLDLAKVLAVPADKATVGFADPAHAKSAKTSA